MSKLINKYVIAIISFYIFWLGLLPLILSNTVTVLCSNLSHNSGYEILIERPKFKLYVIPLIRFKADSIYIKDKDSSDLLSTKNFYVKMRLLPLLTGKVHINNLSVDDIRLKKEIKKDTVLNKDFFKNLEKTNFIFDKVSLNDFNTLFISENKSPIEYKGSLFSFEKKNRYIKLNTDSTLISGDTKSKIYVNLFLPKHNSINRTKFDVEISDLNIEPLGEFFKNFMPDYIKSLNGIINITADNNELKAHLNNLKIIFKDEISSVIFPAETEIKSNFNIKQDLVNLENTQVNAKNISFSASGKIKDYLGKSAPFVDLKVIVNKSRVEDYVNILPPFITEEFNCYKLKKYKFYGDVLGNLTVTGRFPEPNINGKLFIDDGILIKPIPDTSKGATVKLSFIGRHVNYNVNVPAGKDQRVWVEGSQELYNIKFSDLTVKSTKNVSLQSAEEVVNPLHEILNFVVGPLPILKVTGTGNIDLTVKGTHSNPHAWGYLNFYNANVNFTGMPDLILKNANAVLNFDDTNASFKSTNGKVNNQTFDISGICNLIGNFDFDVQSENQPTEALYNALRTATLLGDYSKMLPELDKITGIANLKLKIYGSLKNIEDLKINHNVFAKGLIKLENNEIIIKGVDIKNADAEINLDGVNANAQVKAAISGAPLNINASIKNQLANITAQIPKFDTNLLFSDRFEKEQKILPQISLNGKYKGDINKIEYDKLNLKAKIIPLGTNNQTVNYNSGQVELGNNRLIIKNLDLNINNPKNAIKADLQFNDMFSEKPILNGLLKLKIADIKVLNEIFGKKILPENLHNILKDYEFEEGAINLNARFNDSRLSTDTNLAGIKFNYLPFELPVKILNGKLVVRNNDFQFKAVNILTDEMPILLDGEIKDISDRQLFNIYINSKPKQDFIDKFVNKNTIYPLKIKGDIVYNAIFKGSPDNYNLSAKINMAKDSSIYYYGATVGDVENAIALNLDSDIHNRKEIRIKEFLYDKIIDSQSGRQTRLNMLKVKGGINLLKDDIEFKDLHIKTSTPTDARIFNIIFGKPNIKQGQFTSNLKMRGRLSNPKILGDFHIVETNIPFLDTTMKNIEFLFRDKTLEITSKGEVMGNEVSADAVLQNKLTKPYHIEHAVLTAKDMNLNRLIDKLKSAEAENEQPQDNNGNFDINSFVAKSLKLKADNIVLRNIHASNFEAETSLNEERLFEMKNFVFNIAKGRLNGNYSYNLKNNDITLNMNAESISANDITLAIFDLQNQIYGDLTGDIELSCNGENFERCMQTLNGNTKFNVKDGKMPKLGSLEYLLKAGNLVKGGITSLSINSVIDLISPMKTGEFSDIFGTIVIKDGVANDIEIATQGKDLSLFIGGTYDFSTSVADMEVLGILSRKISTMLGPIGNVSVNTLFNLIPGVDLSKDSDVLANINKIPGIELSGKTYRKFIAKIMGNINGDNYVTSFKWIN